MKMPGGGICACSQVFGHKLMADLAVWAIQRTAIDLLLRPYSQRDAGMAAEPLPHPMFDGACQGASRGLCWIDVPI